MILRNAKAWLREKGMAKAEKKSSRIAAEGAVISKISDDMKTGVLVEINIETDFAANTDKFKKFADNVATHIINRKPSDIQTLMAEPFSVMRARPLRFTRRRQSLISEEYINQKICCLQYFRQRRCCFIYSHGWKDRRNG